MFVSVAYTPVSVARTVKHSMAPTDTAIVEYGIKFADLKAALLAFVTINTEITVLRVFDTVERLGTLQSLQRPPPLIFIPVTRDEDRSERPPLR